MTFPRTPRRLEIERRLALFHANRPKVIARDLGVSVGYVAEISNQMREASDANPAARRATQEGDVKHLGKGL
jgi:hypothetical protein